MIHFIHSILNPHCPDCKEEARESKVCDSCEILKIEIERLRLENQKLLDRILEKPTVETRIDTNDLKPIAPKNISWNVRRQMLESEDRAKAKLMQQAVEIPT